MIFNPPATIVIWDDGTKTVVKCQEGETFDEEKGVALCFAKKALGNKGNYYDAIADALKLGGVERKRPQKQMTGKGESMRFSDLLRPSDPMTITFTCRSCGEEES